MGKIPNICIIILNCFASFRNLQNCTYVWLLNICIIIFNCFASFINLQICTYVWLLDKCIIILNYFSPFIKFLCTCVWIPDLCIIMLLCMDTWYMYYCPKCFASFIKLFCTCVWIPEIMQMSNHRRRDGDEGASSLKQRTKVNFVWTPDLTGTLVHFLFRQRLECVQGSFTGIVAGHVGLANGWWL